MSLPWEGRGSVNSWEILCPGRRFGWKRWPQEGCGPPGSWETRKEVVSHRLDFLHQGNFSWEILPEGGGSLKNPQMWFMHLPFQGEVKGLLLEGHSCFWLLPSLLPPQFELAKSRRHWMALERMCRGSKSLVLPNFPPTYFTVLILYQLSLFNVEWEYHCCWKGLIQLWGLFKTSSCGMERTI